MTSIRRHLTTILTTQLVLAVLAGGVVIWLWARHSILTQFDAALMARAELIQSTIEEDDGHLEIEFNLTRLPEFREDAAPVEFEIRSRDGARLITSPGFAATEVPALSAAPQGSPQYQSWETADGRSYRSLAVTFDAVDDKDGNYAGLRLSVVRDHRQPASSLTRLAVVVGGAVLLSMAALVFMVRRTLVRGLQPLERFAIRTGEIDLTRLPQQVDQEAAPAELQPMVEKLNELLQRVHESLLRERRFTRDVAHELRTPVAELRSISELAGKWSDQATPEAFAEVRDIAAEMESLVAALTLLNRLDAGSVVPAREPASPNETLHHLAERVLAAASARGHTIHWPPDEPAVVWHTDAALWKIAASNLLENAISYSPAGSRITVELTEASFAVQNPAPGLTSEDLARMAHPFWRKDTARHDQSHSGLGLALVDSIARCLGMRFHLSLTPDGQLRCELQPGITPPPDADRR